MAEGWQPSFELFRVFLPKPKYGLSGPGGIEASFDRRAAYDESAGTMLRARLLNDVASYPGLCAGVGGRSVIRWNRVGLRC